MEERKEESISSENGIAWMLGALMLGGGYGTVSDGVPAAPVGYFFFIQGEEVSFYVGRGRIVRQGIEGETHYADSKGLEIWIRANGRFLPAR